MLSKSHLCSISAVKIPSFLDWMGCSGSKKLEEEEAVLLCLDRTRLLADAIRHRYALADAHAAYVRSLRSVGAALQAFLVGSGQGGLPSPSPVLPLPTQGKGDPLPSLSHSPPPPLSSAAAAVIPGHSHKHSHSGSHINFHSSDSDDMSLLDSGQSSPIHLHPDEPPVLEPASFVNLNYARSHPATTTISYEQRPQSSERVQFGSFEPPSTSYGYHYPASTSGYSYQAPTSNFAPYPFPSMGYDSFFGPSSPPQSIQLPKMASEASSSSSSRAPPPPPSPPRASTWDFLNPFESYDNYYNLNTSSRSSKGQREEEGIPDLEEEVQEVVKEVHGHQKFVPPASVAAVYSKAAMASEEDRVSSITEDFHVVESGSTSEDDVDVVDKNVVAEEPEKRKSATNIAPPINYHDVKEIVQEIRTQFDRASESTDHLSKMLEVGKLPFNQKNSIYKASARMVFGLYAPSASKKDEILVFEEDKAMRSGNLSSTLHKLYTWESKLLDEVKAEEEMRLLYFRKSEQLKHLIDKGAEAEKLEEVQTYIKKLSWKIRTSLQAIQNISSNISKLRDEELWSQIVELIQGFLETWRLLLECHHIQCQAISQSKDLNGTLSTLKQHDDHFGATKQLELELLDWIVNFSSWVSAQRNYINCLNGWLVKCINYVPEETDDGVPPFSPGRLGAPPVFVICNYWSQNMDRISESDVITKMQTFADNVMDLWEQYKLEERQRLTANDNMDKKLRSLERDEKLIRKAVEAHKKLDLVPGQSNEVGSLHQNLCQVFEAMENFTARTVKAYEELQTRSEEEKERLARENTKFP